MRDKKMRLGDILVSSGLITQRQLEEILQIQKKEAKKLGELIIANGLLTETQILEVLEFQLGIPHVELKKYYINVKAAKMISENVARKHHLIPINIHHGKLVVAMADPLDLVAIDDVKIITGLDIDVVMCLKSEILQAIDKYYDGKEFAEKAVEEFKVQQEMGHNQNVENEVMDDINNAPMVRLVNKIISQAVKNGASDIHIEPFENNLRVRFRVDGQLSEIMNMDKSTHSAIITRIKIMSKLDISEKRIPQDGRIELTLEEKSIDLRISILPTVYGEKAVIRILDRNNIITEKEQLGFIDHNLMLFEKIIQNPSGIILVTGPTGSGKTTTLYTILSELNEIDKNIITVEDPVEYRVDGINQVQVNTKAGLNFASGLRSILRQDPDVIMVGEIRDSETAQIAVRAAITGHLVLSTLHTNDTASSISRLVDMGIEDYMVSSSVVGIIAQRLVRKICPNCKQEYQSSAKEMQILGLKEPMTLCKGKGCSVCNKTGYQSRVAIHEVMVVDRDLRSLINRNTNMDIMKDKAKENGMLTLYDSCKNLVFDGVTTVEELLKVAYSVDL